VGYRAGRCRLRRSYHASLVAPQCNNRGGKEARLHRRGKNNPTHQLTPRATHPIRHGIRQSYLKWVP
jgi:hypothetical protein